MAAKNADPSQDKEKESEIESTPLYQEEKVLFAWTAQSRPFMKKSRETYITAASIAVLIGFILFVIDGIMPVLVIVAFCFLFYVLHNVEPDKNEYKITTFGVRIADSLIIWDNIGRFWFSHRMGSDVLVLEKAGIIGRIEIVINKKDEEKITKILNKYAYPEKPEDTLLDKSANWVAGKIQ